LEQWSSTRAEGSVISNSNIYSHWKPITRAQCN